MQLPACICVTYPECLTFENATVCLTKSRLVFVRDACTGKRKCCMCDIPVLVCLACCDGRRDKQQGVVLKCGLCVEQGREGTCDV